MKHVGGILTAVALSLSLSGTSIEARGLKQTRRDLNAENVIYNPQETPFFQLLPQTTGQVAQLNTAKQWMNLVGLATFVGVDGQKMTVNRYDGMRGVVENTKHWVDKSSTASRVMHHKTFSYNTGVKTPLQYGKGGRAGSDVDGKLSRAVRANSSEEDYKGPSIATAYAERSPMMLDAKKVDDVETFAAYFAQTLVDNPALNTIVANENARPLLLLTVQKNLLLNEVPAETIQKLQGWFTVTTLAEQDVNKYFAEAAHRVIDLACSYGKDLTEVAVPLSQGLWDDFSSMCQNFDWKRFVRVTLKDGSKKVLKEALPVLVALAAWDRIKKMNTPSMPGMPTRVSNWINKTQITSFGIHAKINKHKKISVAAALAAIALNNVVPVVQERGSIDKMISWKALKAIATRFVRNLYGAKQYEDDTTEKRVARTALNWLAIITLIQASSNPKPGARPSPGLAAPHPDGVD